MAVTYVNQIGATDGMNQAAPSALIPDSSVVWSQDVLFDRPGLMRRRGPFNKVNTYFGGQVFNNFNYNNANVDYERVLGTFFTYDPAGAPKIAVFVNLHFIDKSVKTVMRVFDGSFTYLGSQIVLGLPQDATGWPSGIPTYLPEYHIVSSHTNASGGLWIIFADSITDPKKQFQFYWHGGSGFDAKGNEESTYVRKFTATVNVLVTAIGVLWTSYDSTLTNISSNDIARLSVGQFLYAVKNEGQNYSPVFVGTIKSIDKTAGTITLEKEPNVFKTTVTSNTTASLTTLNNVVFYATSVRPYEHVHGRGLLTTDSGSPSFKSGTIGGLAEGHWKSANIGTLWNVYRNTDNKYLGKVNTITDNATGTFVSNPNITLAAEEYTMSILPAANATISPWWERFSVGATYNDITTFAGLYTTSYQGLQWYAGFSKDPNTTNRITFSAPTNSEAVDLSRDAADSITFPGNSQMRGVASTVSGLVVFLDDKTYIIRGSNRSNFTVEQLFPEGCLSPSSIVEYGGGVFWAASSGLYYYDGASVRNIVQDSMGQYYSDALALFNPEEDVIYAWFYKNYLFITFSNFSSSYTPFKYEPVYETEWDDNVTDPQLNRTWEDLIPGDAVGVSGFGFDYDDFEGPNPSPFYWERSPLIGKDVGDASSVTINWGNPGDTTPIWGSQGTSPYMWANDTGIYKNALSFAIYIPTLALTTIKNLQFNANTMYETVNGSRGLIAVNSIENGKTFMRLIEPKTMLDYDTNGQDPYVVYTDNVAPGLHSAGPDFFLQTKCFTVGDPILRKWFQRLLVNMVLQDGAIRVDFLDSDNNDEIDVSVKKPKTWQIFTPNGYNWRYLTTKVFKSLTSRLTPNWQNIEDARLTWVDLTRSDYERYTKRFSWRKSGLGLRIYQLNNYRVDSQVTTPDKPERVDIQGFTIGFKPLRSGRQ